MPSKKKEEFTIGQLKIQEFGEALAHLSKHDEPSKSWSVHVQIGLTRAMHTPVKGAREDAVKTLAHAFAAAMICDPHNPQLSAEQRESLSSSASTIASTSNLSEEKGKRSTATKKATRSRRVMPSKSAGRRKPLREKGQPR